MLPVPLTAAPAPGPALGAIGTPMLLILIALHLAVLLGIVLFLRVRRAGGVGRIGHRLRAWLGRGRSVADLARWLALDESRLRLAPISYRSVDIPKRRGGTRRLHIPNAQLKRLQRRILRRLLRRLRVHPLCAAGFEPGRSIVHNARFHAGQAVVIKADIVDFFPSTSAARVERYFRRIGWGAEAARILTRLTTWEGGLPQGAPTSPRLSNLVNYGLDHRILLAVARWKGTYTRYADDITISFPEDYPRHVRGIIREIIAIARGHGYTVHRRGKLRILRRHQQQRVTGLVVNDDRPRLPRGTRRRLRAIRHRLQTTGRASLSEHQLRGWDALQRMIERQAREEDEA